VVVELPWEQRHYFYFPPFFTRVEVTIMADSCCCCFCVHQGHAGIIEGIGGQFSDVVAPAGCQFINCCTSKLSGSISLATRNMSCHLDAFSSDNASVHIEICISFRVIPMEVHTAYYKLTAVNQQIQSFVVSNLRTVVQGKRLEELYSDRDELADRVRVSLGSTMRSLGFEIVDVLVVDVDVRGDIRKAFNTQMVQRFQRESQSLQGDIDKIYNVTLAEAQAEATRLRGVGTAAERHAITSAFKDGMAGFHGSSAAELTATMLMIQYFDMLRDLSTGSSPSTILLPKSSAGQRTLDRDVVRERLRRQLESDPSL
jgi:regulator of protease activity HflC (stomatin/prohibitin superfamily)